MADKSTPQHPFSSSAKLSDLPRWDLMKDFLPELTGNESPQEISAAWEDFSRVLQRYMYNLLEEVKADRATGGVDQIAEALEYIADIDVLLSRSQFFKVRYGALHEREAGKPELRQLDGAFAAGWTRISSARRDLAEGVVIGLSTGMRQQLHQEHPETQKYGHILDVPPPPPTPVEQAAALQFQEEQQNPEQKPQAAAPMSQARQSAPDLFYYLKGKQYTVAEQLKGQRGADLRQAAVAVKAKMQIEALEAAKMGCATPLEDKERMHGVPSGLIKQTAEAAMQGKKTKRSSKNVYVGWDVAQQMVIDSFSEVNEAMGTIARKAFEEKWVDAVMDPAKHTGAWSSPGIAQQEWKNGHPHIIMSYGHSVGSALTLAHEMSHAIAQYLERAPQEELDVLGIQPAAIAIPREQSQLSNGMLHETFAKIGEHIMAGHMLEKAKGTEVEGALKSWLATNDTEEIYHSGVFRAEQQLREEAAADRAITPGHIRSVYYHALKDAMPYNVSKSHGIWTDDLLLFCYEPYYHMNYVLAETAGRAFAAQMADAPSDAVRKDMGQRLVNVLASGSAFNAGWSHALDYIGVDVTSPEFTEKAKASNYPSLWGRDIDSSPAQRPSSSPVPPPGLVARAATAPDTGRGRA